MDVTAEALKKGGIFIGSGSFEHSSMLVSDEFNPVGIVELPNPEGTYGLYDGHNLGFVLQKK